VARIVKFLFELLVLTLRVFEFGFEARLNLFDELLGRQFGPGDGVDVDGLVFTLQLSFAKVGALKTCRSSRVEEKLADQNLVRLSLVLDAGRSVDDVAEDIVVFDDAKAGMKSNANMNLLVRRTVRAVGLESPRHAHSGPA